MARYTRPVSRSHRMAGVILLAVLVWAPAHAAVCLSWCDDGPVGAAATPHASHVAGQGMAAHAPKAHEAASQTPLVAEPPCHRPPMTGDVAVASVGLIGCDDLFGVGPGLVPASVRADAVLPPVLGIVVPATGEDASRPWVRLRAPGPSPPSPAPARGPLVLRI